MGSRAKHSVGLNRQSTSPQHGNRRHFLHHCHRPSEAAHRHLLSRPCLELKCLRSLLEDRPLTGCCRPLSSSITAVRRSKTKTKGHSTPLQLNLSRSLSNVWDEGVLYRRRDPSSG